jgi:hypothetical protein
VYERIHFDPTPIDIAFIGTSHTQSGVNSSLVEEAMRRGGVDRHVVNFAIPHLGRDLHYLVARELIQSRTVKRLVIEVQEDEARAPHPAFQRLGEVDDLLSAPLIINTGFVENLARLPLRQSLLFLQTRVTGPTAGFDPRDYAGAHWDDTYMIHGIDVARIAVNTDESLRGPAAKLSKSHLEKRALAARTTFAQQRHSVLQRYSYYYLEALLDLAKTRGVEVSFLYLPFYKGPRQPVANDFFRSRGTIFTPAAILDDPGAWQNEDHLNFDGANRLSDWIGKALTEPTAPRRAEIACSGLRSCLAETRVSP